VPSLAEGTEFAGCRIESVVGRGGMGVVYRATQLGLGRPVALKLLAADRAFDPEFRRRFQREWHMAAAIDHPNIIPVYAAGEEDGTLYLVLRFVDGTDLHGELRRSGPLPPERAASVVAQVGAALDAAHAAGLVHRDVKPGNVLLDGDHVYLSDFGLTRPAAATTQLTEVGRWMGTVDYASPEQLESRPTDARSDVYALGCVLYAALTGGPPFPRDTVPATLLAHLHDPPPRPSAAGAPPEFDRVVGRALAKDPADRYPSAGDLARAAQAAARGEPVTESERSVARGAAAPAGGGNGAPTAATTPLGAASEDVTRRLGGEDAGSEDVTRRLAGEDAGSADVTRRLGDEDAGSEDVTRRLPPDDAAGTRRLAAASDAAAFRAPAPAPPRPPGVRVRGRAKGWVAALVALLGAVAAGLLVAALVGDGDPPATGPVSAGEVRSVVERFARAYAKEDDAALGRTLTRDVERVLPAGRQRGRAVVVGEYRAQFRTLAVADYTLEDLDVQGGGVGRAEGRYVVSRRGAAPFGGSIVFGVVRERGRPRIDLIAARPEA
jgi:Protein kinase domain